MKKVLTDCCALAQIAKVGNNTSLKDWTRALKQLKKEKEDNTEVGISTGYGQTAIFTIVSPGEDKLEENLINLGYTHAWSFERRVGYQPGILKMYIKNL